MDDDTMELGSSWAATIPNPGCPWTRHCFVFGVKKRGKQELSRDVTAEDEEIVMKWFEE